MAIQKMTIEDFVAVANTGIVIDVRSPSEFEHAHIQHAFSLPLFNDEERALVGTTYKQKSREDAIKIGLPLFGNKMLPMIELVEKWVGDFKKKNKTENVSIYVHCWRGGMRSAAVAWLLDLYGFKVHQLIGGYKAYRNWVLAQFKKNYTLKVIGGYTGSGKTEILKELDKQRFSVIDLEGLAHHKGSAFGAMGQEKQPSQEMFENILARALFALADKTILIEDESQRIGTVMLPTPFFKLLRSSDCYFIKIPFESRLDFIVQGYGSFKAEDLIAATYRIQKRLGGLETKLAINHILEKDIKAAFHILLSYYDKWYEKDRKMIPIEANKVAPIENAKLIELCINS
jgi:tRNA 2-selenouridine synthase